MDVYVLEHIVIGLPYNPQLDQHGTNKVISTFDQIGSKVRSENMRKTERWGKIKMYKVNDTEI